MKKRLLSLSRLSLALLTGLGLAVGGTTLMSHADAKGQAKTKTSKVAPTAAKLAVKSQSPKDLKLKVDPKPVKFQFVDAGSMKSSKSNPYPAVQQRSNKHATKPNQPSDRKADEGKKDKMDSATDPSKVDHHVVDHEMNHESKPATKVEAHRHEKNDEQKTKAAKAKKVAEIKAKAHKKQLKAQARQQKRAVKLDHHLAKQMKRFAKVRNKYHYAKLEINARDLGGYPTADDQYVVKSDRLIRSNNLHRLTPAGVKILKNRLHVNDIIDLRDSREIDKQPDVGELGDHANRYRLKIARETYPVYTVHGSAETRADVKKDGEVYRYEGLFDTTPTAIRAYRNVFKEFLKNRHGAVLYHCIEGRDRTGLVSVLMLSALGVNKNDIAKDYLLTDYYRHLHPYSMQINELKHFYLTVQHRYGGMHNYLTKKIGLTDGQIHQLRKMYLVRK